MPQATVKAYDSVTRTGKLITDDGKTEYVVDPEAMDSGMFTAIHSHRLSTCFHYGWVEGRLLPIYLPGIG